ncbi:MAG: MFS transporter [Bryobacterales bacterium]|nr:MFS transporter [Bryobacterales bacterium]
MLQRVFKAFQYTDFRRMWIGACMSSVGTWMQKLAQSWLVLELTNSAWALAIDAFLGEIPIFLFSLLGGVAADRMDRRKLLLMSQFIQMTCAMTLAALLFSGKVRVEFIYLLSFIVGTAQAFGGPAYQSIIPSLVPKEDLQNAIALNSIQFNLARVIGPVIGGIAMAQLGAAWCFTLNGLSFIAVIISLLMLPARLPVGAKKESPLEAMKGGISFVRDREGMLALIVLAFLMTLLGLPLLTFLPVMARNVMHLGADAYSTLLLVSGLGSVAGALIVAGLNNVSHKGRAALLILTLLGGITIAFSASKTLWLSCVILFLGGAALISVFTLVASLVQLQTTDDMRGRVMSVYNVAFRGGMPFGNLTSGRLMEIHGAPIILAINGGLLIALALYFLIVQRKIARI